MHRRLLSIKNPDCDVAYSMRLESRTMHFFNKCLLAGCIQLDYQLFFAKDGQFVLLRLKRLYRSGLHERSEIIFRASASVKSSLLAGSWNI